MKKALIIIGAVFAGLALLAIVGSMLPSDEPQKVVIVKETMEATPIPAVETPATLNGKEQKVYDYIARTYPKVDKVHERMIQAIEDESMEDLVDCCSEFVSYAKSWEKLDWANGQVTTLEYAFTTYMDASRRYYKNWLNGTFGDGDITQCATNAVKAESTMDKWAPRVEERLAEIEDTIY